jgi:Mn-containing catalase
MVDHPAAKALTGYLLVRGDVHQNRVRARDQKPAGAQLMKMFPTPRIATDKIPECRPHIERGDHKRIYRFSPDDYQEIAAVFNSKHPETGDELEVVDGPPDGALPNDLPPQPKAFVPDFHPEEIAEIAARLRTDAGLRKEPTGEVNVPATGPTVVDKVKDALGVTQRSRASSQYDKCSRSISTRTLVRSRAPSSTLANPTSLRSGESTAGNGPA